MSAVETLISALDAPGAYAAYARDIGIDIEWPTNLDRGADAEALWADLYQFVDDPYGFALYAFPWGEPGSPLEESILEDWQVEILCLIRDKIIDINDAIARISIRSGHGIGKSALVAILILWAMLKEDTRGVVTANSERQLRTKTWAELGNWYNMYIGRQLFRLTATSIFPADKNRLLTWRIDLVPWNEKNTSAFQGLHNRGKRLLIIFDEAAEIPKVIWTVAQGALSDAKTQIIWFAAGNPTETSGEFFNIHQDTPHNPWITRRVDSRSVSFTNKAELNRQIAADPEGLESDTIKVRILGEFPRLGFTSFISRAMCLEAQTREIYVDPREKVILGVDVARFGKADSVIYPRRGRDARSMPIETLHGNDTMQLVDLILKCMVKYKTDLVAVDGGGVGGGVIDRLRQLGVRVTEVQFSGKATPHLAGTNRENARYMNKRAEIWGSMRDWLRGGALPMDSQLLEGMCGPKQKILNEDVIQLESKEQAQDRLEREGVIFSLDKADALAITFAINPLDHMQTDTLPQAQQPADYNPYEGYFKLA